MESSQLENWNHLFCRKVSFLTDPYCRFRGVGQSMKQTYLYLWYPLFQAQWDRCDQHNHQSWNYLVKGHHIAEREVKGSDWLLFVFLEKPLYEVCLIRIKEFVGEKRTTVCTHRYADCLLKNTSIKHSKYVVNQKLELSDDISFRERLVEQSGFLTK